VWEDEEGAGPAWTSTAIVPLEDGREGILYFDGFLSPQDTEPDQLEISLLKWDVDGRKLSTTSQFAVPAIEVAGYASVAAAQQARSAQPNCLGLFWVFPADRLSGGASGKYALALPGSSEADLHAVLEQASACVKDRQVSLTSLRQR
jgi:hypothetical protein